VAVPVAGGPLSSEMVKARCPFIKARRTRRRGYTLLELLVVIGIMGFLMSLLLPSLKRSMDLAKATSCKVNLRSLANALQLYRFENDGWLPVVEASIAGGQRGGTVGSATDDRSEPIPWFSQLFPTYLNDPMVLACASDPYGYRVKRVANQIRDPIAGKVSSYGINSFIAYAGGGYLSNLDRFQPARPLDTILVGDLGPDRFSGTGEVVDPKNEVGLYGPSRGDSTMNWSDGFDPFFPSSNENSWLTRRHEHGVHMATIAGEVRDVRTVDLLRHPIRTYYPDCAAAGCTFCNKLEMYHYSFADSRLFWWTGEIPAQ